MVEEQSAQDEQIPAGPSQPEKSYQPRPRGASSSSAASSSNTHSWSSHSWHDSDRNRDRDREAIELHEIDTQQDVAENDDDGFSTASISSGEYRVTTRRTISRTSQRSREPRKGVVGKVERFWTRHVVLTVSHKSNRDHFALERTFLAYIRTSVVLAMQGVLIAQLFRLQAVSTTEHGLGYHEVGVPLSIACHSAAIVTALLGALRFWRQQNAVSLGVIYAGGWELNCIGFLITAVNFTTFVLSVFIAVSINSQAT